MDKIDFKSDILDCCSLFEDSCALPKCDCNHLLRNKINVKKLKNTGNNNSMKLHTKKEKMIC